MKRIIKTSLDDSKYYYLVTVGSGLAWPYLYVIETYDKITDYWYLTNELIEYIDNTNIQPLVYPNSDDMYALGEDKYTWGVDENGYDCLVEKDNPNEVAFHEDEYVANDDYDKVLLHYGQFDIHEIDADEAKKYIDDNATLVEV